MNFDLDAVRRAALTHGYEKALRPALFRIGGGDAEAAHHATITAMAQLGALPGNGLAVDALGAALGGPSSPVTLAGIRFPGRVGLAAGVDKDGVAVTSWQALGFGHVEVGTVTAHPQPGNPTPRLFRLKASEGIINRMGFNNAGSEALADTLSAARATGTLKIPVGVSLGKTKTTAVEEAVGDYLTSLGRLSGLADYFAVNVSSPNTPGLRDLQSVESLRPILGAVREAGDAAAGKDGKAAEAKSGAGRRGRRASSSDVTEDPTPPEVPVEAEPEHDEADAAPRIDLQAALTKAVNATSTDDGWATLSLIGQHLSRTHVDFDPRDFGHSKLSTLVEDQPYLRTRTEGRTMEVSLVRRRSRRAEG